MEKIKARANGVLLGLSLSGIFLNWQNKVLLMYMGIVLLCVIYNVYTEVRNNESKS